MDTTALACAQATSEVLQVVNAEDATSILEVSDNFWMGVTSEHVQVAGMYPLTVRPYVRNATSIEVSAIVKAISHEADIIGIHQDHTSSRCHHDGHR